MQDTTGEFPLAGQLCRIDYGGLIIEHDYRVPGELTFTTISGGDITDTVDITVMPIRDDIFAIAFRDAVTAGSIVIIDMGKNVVNTFMSVPGQPVVHLQGVLAIS